MASKSISVGVGIPMMVVGALVLMFVVPAASGLESTAEFVGSTIGILGAVFFIAGLFYAKQPVLH